MSSIGTIGSAYGAFALPGLNPATAAGSAPTAQPASIPSGDGFGKMIDGLVQNVNAKENASDAITQQVMLGDSGQLHQSVIAMQEASVSFSLMVQVRNKLVDSYQELMRMQV